MPNRPLLRAQILRDHEKESLGLEDDETERLIAIYEEARLLILGRLSEIRAETFTAQHYRVTLAQVQTGLAAMKRKLTANHERMLGKALPLAVRQTLNEIAYWEKRRKFAGGATGRIQTDALRRIARQEGLLLNRFKTSLDRYGLELIGDIQRRLSLGLATRSNWRDMSIDIAGRLQEHAIRGARYKAERIVRTELHGALSAGHQAAFEAAQPSLPGLKKSWDDTRDARECIHCEFMSGQVVRVDQPFIAEGGIGLPGPPLHPGCRCVAVAWRAEWAEAQPQPDDLEALSPTEGGLLASGQSGRSGGPFSDARSVADLWTTGRKPSIEGAPRLRLYRKKDGIGSFIVDGKWVRDNVDVGYTNSGHFWTNPYIPKDEIWLDEQAPGSTDEYAFTDVNERAEREAFIDGASEKAAALAGNMAESELRLKKQPSGIKELSDVYLEQLGTAGRGEKIVIVVVDGNLVRRNFDLDYVEGGHALVYAFIPRMEVWIDNCVFQNERLAIVLHELYERHLMAGGVVDYDEAHDQASKMEAKGRSDPVFLAKTLEDLGFKAAA